MADVTDLFVSIGLLIFLIIGILLSILIRSVASSGAQKVGGKFGRRRNTDEDDSMGFLGSLTILGIVGILFVAFKDELVTIMPSTVTSESFLILGGGFLILAVVLVFLSVR